MDKNIEKYENLPTKSSMRYVERGDKRDRWKWSYNSGGVYRKINNKFPWTHVERILKKYKGKSVDKAFSAYCKIVDQCQQFLFWDELNDDKHHMRRYRYIAQYAYWYVDKNKCVQRFVPKKVKHGYAIHSHNIRWATINIHSGEEVKKHAWLYENNDNYEYTVVEGEIFEFKKKGRAYNKCYAEQLSKAKRDARKERKQLEKKQYSFLTREEEEQIKDIKNDGVIKESHGFTDVSFTNTGGRLNKE